MLHACHLLLFDFYLWKEVQILQRDQILSDIHQLQENQVCLINLENTNLKSTDMKEKSIFEVQ